jgi:hypothetical protein
LKLKLLLLERRHNHLYLLLQFCLGEEQNIHLQFCQQDLSEMIHRSLWILRGAKICQVKAALAKVPCFGPLQAYGRMALAPLHLGDPLFWGSVWAYPSTPDLHN